MTLAPSPPPHHPPPLQSDPYRFFPFPSPFSTIFYSALYAIFCHLLTGAQYSAFKLAGKRLRDYVDFQRINGKVGHISVG